jgi:membrane associated rhomboid family serine protease
VTRHCADSAASHAPVASRTILVVCCVVYFWQWLDHPWGHLAGRALGFTPAWFFAGGGPDAWLSWAPFSVTLITYMFLHAGWLHLAGNMLCLWILGRDVEDALGQPGFIIFYLLCGMAAALAQAALNPASTAPVVGASGAISGLFGGYLVLDPRARFMLRVPLFLVRHAVRMPAYAVLVFWFGVQLIYDIAAPDIGGGVAFGAHVGGFMAGLMMAPVFMLVTGRRRERLPGREGGLLR